MAFDGRAGDCGVNGEIRAAARSAGSQREIAEALAVHRQASGLDVAVDIAKLKTIRHVSGARQSGFDGAAQAGPFGGERFDTREVDAVRVQLELKIAGGAIVVRG